MNAIERAKNTNELKNKVKSLHQNLVRNGKYEHARRILDFLSYSSVVCSLSDVDWEISEFLEKLGLRSRTSSSGYAQTFYLN